MIRTVTRTSFNLSLQLVDLALKSALFDDLLPVNDSYEG